MAFGIDALMQIPWLAAIVSGVVWVGKTVWELIGKTAKLVAVWMAAFVPWLVTQAAKRLAVRLAVVGVWFFLLSRIWGMVTNLIGLVVRHAFPWNDLTPESNFLVNFFWNDPVNLRDFVFEVLPNVMAAVSAAYSIRVIWSRVRWAFRAQNTQSS